MKDSKIIHNSWIVRRFNFGMTKLEIKKMLRALKINNPLFWKKFGVNTCVLDEQSGESLFYLCDIERTVRLIREKREMYSWEMD